MSASSQKQADDKLPAVPPTAPLLRLSATGADGPVECETSQPVTLIGSRRDCQLPLAHPDVSKVHCAIVNTGRTLVACDLSSRSGTFVNDQPIRRAPLKPGDTLRLGPVALQIEFLTAPPAGAGNHDRLHPPLLLRAGDKTFELRECVAVIGRRNTCDVFLDTPDVSLAHALIFALDRRPALCDLGSRSGTIVNGGRTALAWLADGDKLDIGGEQLAVTWKSATAAPAQPAIQAAAASPAPEVPADGDLQDLESSLAVLHAHIAGSRGKLAERSAELDHQSAELEARAVELNRQSADLQARAGELERHRQKLVRAQEELAKRAGSLQAAEDAAQTKLAEALEREKAVKAQQDEVAQLQARLAEQRAESETLAERTRQQQAELAAQAQQLEEGRAAFAKQQQEAQTALEAITQQKQALAERESALQAAADELSRQKEQFAAAQAELAQRTAQCAEATQALEKQQAELAQREAQQAAATQNVQQREAALADKEGGLRKREEEVGRRSAALQQREAMDKAAARRIGEFRRALHQATKMFTEPVPGTTSSGTQTAGSAPSSAATPTVAPAAPQGAQAAPAAEIACGTDLPAPVVDQPIFGTQTTALPSDWPPEMCERFRVLRRMSPKSDAELIAQVLAEREGGLLAPRKEKEKEKKSRGWLRARRDG